MTRTKKGKTRFFNKCLNRIEKVGNKLPHPITLFAIFGLAIIVISAICAALGVSVTGEIINRKTNQIETQTIEVISLLSKDGLVHMLTKAITNFTSFVPLGVVLVSMLGVGIAEGSGYISALLKRTIGITPKVLITPMVVFLGVMSNVASDAGYVVLIPLGALMFIACGRHPLAGIAAAFAGVSGGFSANLIIGTLDPMLAGLSTEAAHIFDPNYNVLPTANLYFMFISTFLVTIIGTIITNKIVEPRLGEYKQLGESHSTDIKDVSLIENKALRWANITLILLVIGLIVLALPQSSFLRNPETGSLINKAPFMDSIVVIISILFFVPSIVYGRVAKTMSNEKDVAEQMGKTMSTMGGYIALVFVCAQFVDYFNYTNIGTIIALKGAEFLKSTGLNGWSIMVLFILLTALINLFMGSSSAKWAIMAPVFIPMFMAIGYSPELVQVAYRIGDSTTNIISPLMSYFAMIVVFAKQYDKKSGVGTIISTMTPYSIAFLIGWSILLVVWMLFGWPLGPNAPIYL